MADLAEANYGTNLYWTVQHIRERFDAWHREVVANPSWWGFSSKLEVQAAFAKTPVQMATEMCISQKGYFLTGGSQTLQRSDVAKGVFRRGKKRYTAPPSASGDTREWPVSNQLCEKTQHPVVFLCTPGVDFMYPLNTEVECKRYFVHDPTRHGAEGCTYRGWSDWLPQGKESFHKRIKAMYHTIFSAAQAQGVRNPSTLPLGLGMFLSNLEVDRGGSKVILDDVKALYFRVQFELLSEADWGFENYFLNPQQFYFLAIDELKNGLAEGGPYNNPQEGRYFRCSVVLHDRDAKFLAQQLAFKEMAPAFLNPSDSQAILHGMLGMFWEVGRGYNYVGEEDWAATSTGTLASLPVSRTAVGLDDVVFQLQCGDVLHVQKVNGNAVLQCILSKTNTTASSDIVAINGPYRRLVACDFCRRKLRFEKMSKDKEKDREKKEEDDPKCFDEYDLAPITQASLIHFVKRVLELERCAKEERPPFRHDPVGDIGRVQGRDWTVFSRSAQQQPQTPRGNYQGGDSPRAKSGWSPRSLQVTSDDSDDRQPAPTFGQTAQYVRKASALKMAMDRERARGESPRGSKKADSGTHTDDNEFGARFDTMSPADAGPPAEGDRERAEGASAFPESSPPTASPALGIGRERSGRVVAFSSTSTSHGV